MSGQVSSGVHPSTNQQQAGHAAASGAHVDRQVRYTPYAIPFYRHRSRRENMEGNKKPQEQGMEGNGQDKPSRSWFKISIPFGIKYDEKWLLSVIQKQCNAPFTPVEFHYEKMEAQFFVEGASVAFELKNISGRLLDEDNEKISILVSASEIPHSVQRQPQSEMVEMTKPNTDKICDISQLSLDIQRLCFDPGMDSGSGPKADWTTDNTAIAPEPRDYKAASLQNHEASMMKLLPSKLSNTIQNVSITENLDVSKYKMKPAVELGREKGQGSEEMCTEKASLSTTFPDKCSGISSSVLEMFPKLLCLGGQYSLSASNFCTEVYKTLPTCKGGFLGTDALKDLVLQFLQQYYSIYDYGDRQGLLAAYHEKACFSLSIPFNPKDPTLSCLYELYKDSRNMKKLTDPYLRVQLLKYTKHDIVRSLCMLPKTQHDLSSFVVDMWVQTETMFCFSVYGIFKEVEGEYQGSVRAFTRTFVTTPESHTSLCIMNDELSVRVATPSEIQRTFSMLMPTPTLILSQEQQKMVQAFSIQSGMNLQWSHKYLHDSDWDYNRAIQALSLPKQGKVKDFRRGPHTD
ncbi:nuclear RNA export factor 3 [Erinaceus europaeus]|uniref:Nuclear RNA export factor 3 n=1 Tax=Erinaceus europaeus TaxID=9365 RepID=A0ABM3WSY6_ERIEU|nr:nuclear RNA export factor 3 [Erinaceus europaeus]